MLEVRDPIHGFIHREPYVCDIVDTPMFQRLRRLKQLAFAFLVYPGANHTRFEHSLGAFHVAGNLAHKLGAGETDCRLVTLAALLHDVGHGPFSHVTEPILQQHSPKEALENVEGSKIHEVISHQIITSNPELSTIISEKERKQVVAILKGESGYSFLRDIVSGPIDADKQDYLLRDSYFSGVKYGVYDIERLSDSLRVHNDGDDKVLAISVDGIHALEQFVLAKYYMMTQVYRHRLRLITDAMVQRAIGLGITIDGLDWLSALYRYDGSDEYIREYLQWTDDRLVNKAVDSSTPDGYAKDMFKRLLERRLFKCIFTADQADFPDALVRSFVFTGTKEFYGPLEGMIGKEFGIDPNHVIAFKIDFDSATKTESEISVIHPYKTTSFQDESALFKSADQKIREQHFQIYAPFAYADELDKKRKMNDFRSAILGMLNELSNPQKPLAFESTAGAGA
jgi:HD superfamily phosphohydrolase